MTPCPSSASSAPSPGCASRWSTTRRPRRGSATSRGSTARASCASLSTRARGWRATPAWRRATGPSCGSSTSTSTSRTRGASSTGCWEPSPTPRWAPRRRGCAGRASAACARGSNTATAPSTWAPSTRSSCPAPRWRTCPGRACSCAATPSARASTRRCASVRTSTSSGACTTGAGWVRQRAAYGHSSGELARRHGRRVAPVRVDAATSLAWGGAPLFAARWAGVVRDDLARRLDDDDPENAAVAGALARRAVVLAGGPLARALTRTYAPVLLVAAALPRTRRRALLVLAAGVAWRLHGRRARAGDVPLALADDVVYSVGVARGAWAARTWTPLLPSLTTSRAELRALVVRAVTRPTG